MKAIAVPGIQQSRRQLGLYQSRNFVKYQNVVALHAQAQKQRVRWIWHLRLTRKCVRRNDVKCVRQSNIVVGFLHCVFRLRRRRNNGNATQRINFKVQTPRALPYHLLKCGCGHVVSTVIPRRAAIKSGFNVIISHKICICFVKVVNGLHSTHIGVKCHHIIVV